MRDRGVKKIVILFLVGLFVYLPVLYGAARGASEALGETSAHYSDYWAGGQRALNARLRDAVSNGDRSKVRSLLAQNASPNTRYGSTGLFPLIIAVANKRLDIVHDLLEGGASDSVNWLYHSHTPLMIAAKMGNVVMVRELLGAGADASIDAWDWDSEREATALLLASERKSSIEIVRLLLDAGASIAPNRFGYGPIQAATRWSTIEVVSELLCVENGTRLSDQNKDLVLMMAFDKHLYGIAEKLIVAGADLAVVNDQGFTIFDMARMYKKEEMLGRALRKRNQLCAKKCQEIKPYLGYVDGLAALVVSYESEAGATMLAEHAQAELVSKEAEVQRMYERSWRGKGNALARRIATVASNLLKKS